ncbi:Zn-ribbon domain-containing OB-fold protein [Archaeoglobus neptunius]|uniref:Zn-ribbon domain-containing OB-fold protein n=1 Tax=Archaeoglobus neptunius TaxID=2798580 RepID=UPI00192520F3|nr:Zn-ribbon domain-containing OB-fold protein [Archaeoglobus neptunius]
MGLIKEKYEKTMQVEGEWNVGAYRWKAPAGYLDEFVRNFRDRKITGTLCKECGRVYVPPREICARCFTEITEKVEVSQYGEVLAFLVSPPLQKGKVIIAGIDAVEAGFLKEGERVILAMVRFEGTSSSMVLPLLNVEPGKVRVGMKVKAVWAEECKGVLADLLGVKPAYDVRFE